MDVDLSEVGGPEVHPHVELWQRVCQPRPIEGMQRGGGLRACGLKPHLNVVGIGEGSQGGQIPFTERQQMAKDKGRCRVADCNLDLRHPVSDRQPTNQDVQRRHQRGDLRRQHRARLHVSNVARALLVKADQHSALARHHTHAQPGTITIAPGWTMDRRVDDLGFDFPDVPQSVFQDSLLGRRLCQRIEMLHGAPATDAKMRAVWCDALSARPEHPHHLRLGIARSLAQHSVFHLFTGQRALDENGFAVDMADAATFVIERFNKCNRHEDSAVKSRAILPRPQASAPKRRRLCA